MLRKMLAVEKRTLKDIYEDLSGEGGELYQIETATKFTTLCMDQGYNPSLLEGKEDIINELYHRYLYPTMFNEYILASSSSDEDLQRYEKGMLGQLLYSILNTYDKYSLIINKYEGIKNNLVDNNDEIVGENISKYNDTPQSEGDYSANEFTTNITQSTSKTDNSNKMLNIDKLVTLQTKLENTYQMWANFLFNRFVIL